MSEREDGKNPADEQKEANKITVEMIMRKNPCCGYPESRVAKLVGKGKTLLELLDLDIPEKDRIWVVTRFLDDKTNRAFAIWCARRCEIDVKEIKNYIDVIERFYDGKATKEELRVAYWAAARAAGLVDWVASAAGYVARNGNNQIDLILIAKKAMKIK